MNVWRLSYKKETTWKDRPTPCNINNKKVQNAHSYILLFYVVLWENLHLLFASPWKGGSRLEEIGLSTFVYNRWVSTKAKIHIFWSPYSSASCLLLPSNYLDMYLVVQPETMRSSYSFPWRRRGLQPLITQFWTLNLNLAEESSFSEDSAAGPLTRVDESMLRWTMIYHVTPLAGIDGGKGLELWFTDDSIARSCNELIGCTHVTPLLSGSGRDAYGKYGSIDTPSLSRLGPKSGFVIPFRFHRELNDCMFGKPNLSKPRSLHWYHPLLLKSRFRPLRVCLRVSHPRAPLSGSISRYGFSLGLLKCQRELSSRLMFSREIHTWSMNL